MLVYTASLPNGTITIISANKGDQLDDSFIAPKQGIYISTNGSAWAYQGRTKLKNVIADYQDKGYFTQIIGW